MALLSAPWKTALRVKCWEASFPTGAQVEIKLWEGSHVLGAWIPRESRNRRPIRSCQCCKQNNESPCWFCSSALNCKPAHWVWYERNQSFWAFLNLLEPSWTFLNLLYLVYLQVVNRSKTVLRNNSKQTIIKKVGPLTTNTIKSCSNSTFSEFVRPSEWISNQVRVSGVPERGRLAALKEPRNLWGSSPESNHLVIPSIS